MAVLLGRSPELRDRMADGWGLMAGPPTRDGRLWLRREWHHLDLIMHVRGRQVLAVENKVFSLPGESQFAGYGAAVRGKPPGQPSLVLLSLTGLGWPGDIWVSAEGSVWRYRSCIELADLIRALVPAAWNGDPFPGELPGRWADLLRRLVKRAAVAGLPGDDEPLLLDRSARRQLQRVRLGAPVQKMRCQQVAAHVRRALAAEIQNGDLHVMAGLSNAAGFVQAFTRDAPHVFGWQLQSGQFRPAVIWGGTIPDMAAAPQPALPASPGRTAHDLVRLWPGPPAHPRCWTRPARARRTAGLPAL